MIDAIRRMTGDIESTTKVGATDKPCDFDDPACHMTPTIAKNISATVTQMLTDSVSTIQTNSST